MTIMKGYEAIKEAQNSSTPRLKLKDGESAVIRFLQKPEDIISVYEYTVQINGKWRTIIALPKEECPLYAAGHKPSFKSYLVVLDRSDDKVKIFKASKSVGRQLLGLIEEYGDITARDFKILRQGEKLKTTYQFFPKDMEEIDFEKYADQIPDLEEMLKPMSREQLVALMSGIDTVTDVDEKSSDSDDGFPF
jgi:hypothetical protein